MILKQSLLVFMKTGAVPLLLVAVALRQIVLVHVAGLSPWHGGGFGMFASLDRDERRIIITQLLGCDQTVNLTNLAADPKDSPTFISQARYTHVSTFPTTSLLRHTGQRLLESAVVEGEPNCGEAGLQIIPWRLVYDGESIAYEPLTETVKVQP